MTSRLLLPLSTSLLAAGAVLLLASPASAASWETITDYGGATNMVIYVPDDVDESPGIAVALHSCGNPYEGDSQNYFRSSADEHGFIVIAPTNGSPDCWNATAGQDGEKPDIVQMVEWVVANRNGDSSRVYVGGASSGACMTVALLAAHPDVFAAGTMMAGVPYGAWSGGNSCGVCSQAPMPRSEQEWGDIVRNNAPQGFTGPWPRLQVWHGDADTTLLYGWESETEKQWKNLWGLTGMGEMVAGPSGWNRVQYESDGTVVLQVNRGPGKGHYLPSEIPQGDMISFFGLDQDAPDPGNDTTDGSDTDDSAGTTTTTGTDTGPTGDGTTTGGNTTGDGTTTGAGTTTGSELSTSTSGTDSGDDDEEVPEDPSSSDGADDDDEVRDQESSGSDDPAPTSGCACEVPRSSTTPPTLTLLCVAGMGAMLRRRRTRHA